MHKTPLKRSDPHLADTAGGNNFTYGYLAAVASGALDRCVCKPISRLGRQIYVCVV